MVMSSSYSESKAFRLSILNHSSLFEDRSLLHKISIEIRNKGLATGSLCRQPIKMPKSSERWPAWTTHALKLWSRISTHEIIKPNYWNHWPFENQWAAKVLLLFSPWPWLWCRKWCVCSYQCTCQVKIRIGLHVLSRTVNTSSNDTRN